MNHIDSYPPDSGAAAEQEIADKHLVGAAESAIRGLCDVAATDAAYFRPWQLTRDQFNGHHLIKGATDGESFRASYDHERDITRLDRQEIGYGADGNLVTRYSSLVIAKGQARFGLDYNVGVQEESMHSLTAAEAGQLIDFVVEVRQSNSREFSVNKGRRLESAGKSVGKRVLETLMRPVGGSR